MKLLYYGVPLYYVIRRSQLLDIRLWIPYLRCISSLVKRSNFFLWPVINWQRKIDINQIKRKNLTFSTSFLVKTSSNFVIHISDITSSDLRKSVIWIRFSFTGSKKSVKLQIFHFQLFNFSQESHFLTKGNVKLRLSVSTPELSLGCKAGTERTHARTEFGM